MAGLQGLTRVVQKAAKRVGGSNVLVGPAPSTFSQPAVGTSNRARRVHLAGVLTASGPFPELSSLLPLSELLKVRIPGPGVLGLVPA